MDLREPDLRGVTPAPEAGRAGPAAGRQSEDPGEVTIERFRGPCYQQSVRLAAAVSLVLLGACPRPYEDDAPIGGGECFVDQECITGEICARDDQCWPESEVRSVKTTWTLRGQDANPLTCAQTPDLHIIFDGNVRDDLGFSPVPCSIGQFVVDRLPRPFTRVELGVDNGPWRTATIGVSGTAAIDLPF